MINTTRTEYVRIDGWRGYQRPVNAIAGANDTGTYEDSPCPSHLVDQEIKMLLKELRKQKIKYRTTWGNSSNVFCMNRWVCVAPEDKLKAQSIAYDLTRETNYLYNV